MKRLNLFTVLLLMAALVLSLTIWPAPSVSASPEVDPLLVQQLDSAGKKDLVTAILTYTTGPVLQDVEALKAKGALVHQFSVLPMLAAQGTPAQIRSLLTLPNLRSVFANRSLKYHLHESVPLIKADRVWNEMNNTGQDIGVAVIDTGIDALHPDLTFGPVTVQNIKIINENFFIRRNLEVPGVILENQPNTDTSSGHGTHVAGIIAARGVASNGYYRGVAPGSKLIGIGAGDALVVLYALQGFDYILQHQKDYNIQIVNNSWGPSGGGGKFDPDDPINVATKQVNKAGISVVFAAGNDGCDIDLTMGCKEKMDTINTYSLAPWVISVAAGEKDGQNLAAFSSRGNPNDPANRPTLTAPGNNIVSTRAITGVVIAATGYDAICLKNPYFGYLLPEYLPYYTCAPGTSMAAPHVAGTLALMRKANPKLEPDVLKELLVNTATPMPGYQPYQVGAGYLNAYAATQAALALVK